ERAAGGRARRSAARRAPAGGGAGGCAGPESQGGKASHRADRRVEARPRPCVGTARRPAGRPGRRSPARRGRGRLGVL
ncbi:MAG: hypothetical protein AVDCRST_MAG16-937, partial [uncultured Frankineae bacterium]